MDASPEPSSDTPAESEAELMARNGIRCVPMNYYHVDGYRYTRLADALAQASRGAIAARAKRRSHDRPF